MRKIIVEAEVALDGVIGGENPDFWTQVFKYHGEDVLGYLKHLLFTPGDVAKENEVYMCGIIHVTVHRRPPLDCMAD